ncbi:MAG: C39 family peptidase [Paracraurococcus sp.]
MRSFLEARQDAVVIQQWDISCGAAALATILTYQHGDPVTEKEVAAGMLRRTNVNLVRRRLGFSLLDLKRYAESRGLAADGYSEMTLSDLMEAGPTIVPVILRSLPHFVIFRGIQGDRVLLADPAFGNRTMRIEAFERVWQSRMGFTVTRSDGRPPPNRLAVRSADFWASSLAYAPSRDSIVMAARAAEPGEAALGPAEAATERPAPSGIAPPIVLAGGEPPQPQASSTTSADRDAAPRHAAGPVASPSTTRRMPPRIDRTLVLEANARDPAIRQGAQDAARPEHGRAAPVGRWAAAMPATAPTTPLDALQRRGEAMLALGDISAARLLYERAAAAGSASAARALGETYDPAVLTQLGVRGLQADPARAVAWYERAASLGDVEAASRIRTLRDMPGISPATTTDGPDQAGPAPAKAPRTDEHAADIQPSDTSAETWALLEAGDALLARLALRIEILEGDRAVTALARRIDRLEADHQSVVWARRIMPDEAEPAISSADDDPIVLAEAWSSGLRPEVAAMIAERLTTEPDDGPD